MPFVQQNTTMAEVKKNLHQDYFSIWGATHDEIQGVSDCFLFEPLMSKMADVAENKNLFTKLGFKYIRFYFDIEFDQFGSYTASKKFDVYGYQKRVSENKVLLDNMDDQVLETSSVAEAKSKLILDLTGVQPSSSLISDLERLVSIRGGQHQLHIKNGDELLVHPDSMVDLYDIPDHLNFEIS